ncbi:c-type cytochrome [Flavisolibacter tropicus]|uniref:c-type cytochrome n=1 Tax=Flavisolibacter tropicus TaxID=1492898 RepID=UPI0008363317|nr:cytochrome c [Flavisolibacter tropicus]
MFYVRLLFILVVSYACYSFVVYTKGTAGTITPAAETQQVVSEGKQLYQQYNCTACHQIYGLGGYLGPELTTAYSDKNRGEAYMRAMLQAGGSRMPNFHFTSQQIDALIAYLKYVDTTATPIKD